MAMTKLSAQVSNGVAVEMSRDEFTGQYTVDAGGVAIYDTCDRAKGHLVYEYLLGLPSEIMSELIDYAEQVRDHTAADAERMSDLEVVAGAGW